MYCYTGKQGTGKTYSAIKFIIDEKLRNDCLIITNIHSFKMFDDIVYIDNILDIINFVTKYTSICNDKPLLVFYDEIFSCIEKNKYLSADILSFISQLRKRGVIFVTTAQEWAEINITLRRYVRYQVSCNMLAFPFTNKAILLNVLCDGDNIRWDSDAQEFIAPIIKTKISKGLLSVANSYDTFETVSVNLK